MSRLRKIRICISDATGALSRDAKDFTHAGAASLEPLHLAETLDHLLDDNPEPDSDRVITTDPVATVRLDLGELDSISTAALNELIDINRRAKNRGLRLVLENANEVIRSIFSLTRLERMFEIAPVGGN